MITRERIREALDAYWKYQDMRDVERPWDHPAVQELLDEAGRADAVRERTLRGAFLPSSPELIDHLAAEIHAAICDADNRSCITSERLEAAAHAVHEIIAQCQANLADQGVKAAVLEHLVARRGELPPEVREILEGREGRAEARLQADGRLKPPAGDSP